jgi:hypothetical protein
MTKALLPLILFFCCNSVSAQQPSFHGHFKLKKLAGKDFVNSVDLSHSISITGPGKTQIYEIGSIDGNIVGMQMETLTSNLSDSLSLVFGVAYYTKQNEKWVLYAPPSYRTATYKLVSSRHECDDGFYSHLGLGMQDLQVQFYYRFYSIR